MIRLQDKTNTMPPTSDYPFGDIRDDTGTGNGTPIDRQVYADIHQFFAKMFFESGITSNGLADNATNGFQLWNAFSKFTSTGVWIDAAAPVITTAGISGLTKTYNKIKIVGKLAHWKCVFRYQLATAQPFLELDLPIEITSLGYSINAAAPYSLGLSDSGGKVMTITSNSFGYLHLNLARQDGTNLPSTGGGSTSISFDIVLELVP